MVLHRCVVEGIFEDPLIPAFPYTPCHCDHYLHGPRLWKLPSQITDCNMGVRGSVGMIPTIFGHLLAKPHFRKRWSHVSSFYRMQFSHMYESSYMVFLLGIALLFSLLSRSSQNKSFLFRLAFGFPYLGKCRGVVGTSCMSLYIFWAGNLSAILAQSHLASVAINSTIWGMLVSDYKLRVSLCRHGQV